MDDPLDIELFHNELLMISFVYDQITCTEFEGKQSYPGKITCFYTAKKAMRLLQKLFSNHDENPVTPY